MCNACKSLLFNRTISNYHYYCHKYHSVEQLLTVLICHAVLNLIMFSNSHLLDIEKNCYFVPSMYNI